MYIDFYRQLFASVGKNLNHEDGIPDSEIDNQAVRLGVHVPASVRAFYRVAGRETQFNQEHDRLLLPNQWYLDHGRLIFYEENQCVVNYGFKVIDANQDDPIAYAANPDDEEFWVAGGPITKYLSLQTYWQAVFGGAIGYVGWCHVCTNSPDISDRLSAWEDVGELSGIRCYLKPGRIIWFGKDGDGFVVFGGVVNADDKDILAQDLGLEWDEES